LAHVEDETTSTETSTEDETTSSVAPPPASAAGAFRAACAAIDRVELFRDALAAAAASRRGLDVARVLSSVAASASGRGLGARARFLAERASARVETGGGGDCGATIDVSSSLAAVDVSSSRSSDANFAARSGDVRAAAAKALRLDLVREGTPEAVARGTRRGWVFWYVGSPVVVGTRRFVFDPRRLASDGERFAELADDEQRST
jgi:hypothetical protein